MDLGVHFGIGDSGVIHNAKRIICPQIKRKNKMVKTFSLKLKT